MRRSAVRIRKWAPKDIMNIEMLFPTPVAVQRYDKSSCKEYAQLLIDMCNSVDRKPYSGCFVSDDDLNERQEFLGLFDLINGNVMIYAEEVLGVSKDDIKIDCMWANVHDSGHKHQSHVHPNSFISGVFYLQVPEESEMVGDLYFNDPRTLKSMMYADFKKSSPISDRNWIYKPETGMMVLFPGWLEHGTNIFVCNSGEKRVAVSFNYSVLKCSSKTMRFNHG